MAFSIQRLDTHNCGSKCPEVIVADGVIETDTAEAFVDFAKSTARSPDLRAIVLINSPGGNVVASMQFGSVLRQLHMAAIVARMNSNGAAPEPVAGRCISACVYAIMGAVKRVVPRESQVGLHRMSIIENTTNRGRSVSGSTRSFADSQMVSGLARYAARMGVSSALVATAEGLRPDEVHMLSPAELTRWRLATSRF
jgi:hypothetical protein